MYRFGAFQVDPREHELRRDGVRIKIQEQSLIVLLKLLERPGHLVSRDELSKAIWPANTFVDFEIGLNKIIKRLRDVLGDFVDAPTFIETVPKLGYRFIAPVELHEGHRPPASDQLGKQSQPTWVKCTIAATIFLVASLATYSLLRRFRLQNEASMEIVPLTGMQGIEDNPAFSPDGNQVAFVLHGVSEGRSGIYVTVIGGEKALQLSNDPHDCCPVWSPDSRSVAVARRDEESYSIQILPALGGTPKEVYFAHGLDTGHHGGTPYFAWAPNGKMLAVSAASRPKEGRIITLVSLADSSTHALTSPPPGYADWSPAFSPDGESLAFRRTGGLGFVDDLYVLSLAEGNPRQLTFDGSFLRSAPAWTPDSREIIFTSTRGGLAALWRMPASGGTPRRIAGVGTSAIAPTVSLKGHRLAYTSVLSNYNLWSLHLVDSSHATGPAVRTVASKGQNAFPSFSPDGRKIAFESDRSGYTEIWTAESNGSNPTQLTFLNGEAGTPRWSYDSRYISFDYRSKARRDIYVAEVPTGTPRMVATIAGADNVVPSWSRDGKWLYFASSRDNEPAQVWKMAYPIGVPIRLTSGGGTAPIESADGLLYYSKTLITDEVWRVPTTGGGSESLVMKAPGLACWCQWSLGSTGIYFLPEIPQTHTLFFYDFETRKTIPVAVLGKNVGNPTISPDGKSLIYSQRDLTDHTIMLVNNFQ